MAAVIRPAVPGDLVRIAGMAGSADRAEMRLRAAEHGDETMLVAVADAEVLGVTSVRWADGCDPPHPWLYGLHVAADHRRRGIGRALMAAGEDVARERGAAYLSLDVDRADDRAVGFYRGLGYRTVRPHEHRWRSVDPHTGAVLATGTADTWIMRRPLR
jgi:ribosomal protein S18 acetylase RimI-like enzyme